MPPHIFSLITQDHLKFIPITNITLTHQTSYYIIYYSSLNTPTKMEKMESNAHNTLMNIHYSQLFLLNEKSHW